MSVRQAPSRPHPSPRPPWLLPLLTVVAVLVIGGLIFGLVSLIRGSGDDSATASEDATPNPCATEMVPASEVLPPPSKVKVNVYNATGVAGLASKTASALEKAGFKVGKVANDPVGRTITGVGQIRYGPKAVKRAELLSLYVPGAVLVELTRTGPKVDLAMGDSFEGLAPEQQVNAALASPRPVVTGVGCAPSSGATPEQ
jgi:hypothetical protein